MKNTILPFIALILLITSCQKDDIQPSIMGILENREDISASEKANSKDGYRIIEFFIKQPVDHNNPEGEKFIQSGTLLHRDYNLPILFMPNGYGNSDIRHYDLTQYYFEDSKHHGKPNLLTVDHRYYGNGGKDFQKLDPQFLTIEQAARDLHRIVEIFKEAYKSSWISMGYSKGGRTCVYHKYFFPDDIDATLSFVAPITMTNKDTRFESFVPQISTPEEYDKMLAFQRLLLEKREGLGRLIEKWYAARGLTMDRDVDKVIEGIALGYPFSYWQYRSYWWGSKTSILNAPTSDNDVTEIFDFLSRTYFLDRYSTKDDVKYAPYYYQSRTQLGYPLYAEYDKLSDLLIYYKSPSENSYSFDAQAVQDIISWLDTDGNNIIHIYGSKDPWTAAMYNRTPNVDAITIIENGADHLIDLNSLTERKVITNKLEMWTGFTIQSEESMLKSTEIKRHIDESERPVIH
ncbi:MAG: hypothetical protein MI866_17645 [Bacteroidales bacterium]|nr:hypothetical protein [Bacteroidales bacterium]